MAATMACTASAAVMAGRPAPVSRPCSARPRAFAGAHSLRGTTFTGQRVAAPVSLAARGGRAQRFSVQANALTDVGKYLSDAAKQIFSPTTSDVQWPEASSFTGKITHHEDAGRVRKLYEVLQSTRQQLEGCTDPNAANYEPAATNDDGSCTYVFNEDGTSVNAETLGEYVSTAVGSVFGSNFKGGENEPDWTNTTYNYSGQIVSQRDIQRLLHYEKVVKKTLEKVEESAKQ